MSGPENAKDRVSLKRHILVVDDAELFRDVESLFLARLGRVSVAAGGSEALSLARSERPDVIVTDLSMPGLGGDALCAEVKRDPDLRHTPVIIVTGGTSPDEHERAVLAGADDVLEKPVSRISMIQAVAHFLRVATRGLARIPFETNVRMSSASGVLAWGRSLNLSRGGMFVELEQPFALDDEIELEFQVPPASQNLLPTARVVWQRPTSASQRPGIGLQFLKLDRNAARALEDYVYEVAGPAYGSLDSATAR